MSLSSRSLRAFTLVCALNPGTGGCVSAHAQIPAAPQETASLSTRRAYYRRYHMTEINHVGTPWVHGLFSPGNAMRARLADGQTVADPADLRPALRSNSRSMVALRRANDVDVTFGVLYVAGFVLLGVGSLGLGSNGFGAGSSGSFAWTIASLAAANVVLQLDLWVFGRIVGGERERALLLYNDSLRERLALCGDGTEMGDCADATNPAVVARVDPPRATAATLASLAIPTTLTSRNDGAAHDGGLGDGADSSATAPRALGDAATDASAIDQ